MPISDDQHRAYLGRMGTRAAVALALSVSVATLGFLATKAHAFDPSKTFKPDEEPRMILRYGFNALKQGNLGDAVGAFRFGAEKNDLASQWKLARMLQRGSGVEQNHLAAYRLFEKISMRFAENAPFQEEVPYVANALVAMGRYSLTGIDGTEVQSNPRMAEYYFYRAAALYKDPEAQFQLGRLYRGDALGARQPRTAVRWYGLAARKGHALAQSELGEMLFYGEGIRKSPVRGLVFMTRASLNNNLKAIQVRHREAFAQASESERIEAQRILAELLPPPAPETTKSIVLDVEAGPATE